MRVRVPSSEREANSRYRRPSSLARFPRSRVTECLPALPSWGTASQIYTQPQTILSHVLKMGNWIVRMGWAWNGRQQQLVRYVFNIDSSEQYKKINSLTTFFRFPVESDLWQSSCGCKCASWFCCWNVGWLIRFWSHIGYLRTTILYASVLCACGTYVIQRHNQDCEQSLIFYRFSEGSACARERLATARNEDGAFPASCPLSRAWTLWSLSRFARRTKKKEGLFVVFKFPLNN